MRVALRPKTVADRTSSSRLAAGATLSPSSAIEVASTVPARRSLTASRTMGAGGSGVSRSMPSAAAMSRSFPSAALMSSATFSRTTSQSSGSPPCAARTHRRCDSARQTTIAREGTTLAAPVAPVERRAEYLCEVGHGSSSLKQRSVTPIGIRSDGLSIDEAMHCCGVDPAPESEDKGPSRQLLLGAVSFLVDA